MQLFTGIILVLALLAIIFVSISLLIYYRQEEFFFYPTKLSPNYPYDQFPNHKELLYDTPNNGLINALLFEAQNSSNGLVFYSHGNSRSLDDWAWVHKEFNDLGYDILLYDYRTFGKSSGVLSEENLYSDARHLLNEMLKSYPLEKIVLYGRSLGAAIATQMATEFSVKSLIIETPFSSMLSMVRKSTPLFASNIILRYKLDNFSKMNLLKCPVHILHGTKDELIPISHAEMLSKANNNSLSSFSIIEGASHNNLSQFDSYHLALKKILG